MNILKIYLNKKSVQILLVILLAFACYANTLSNNFAWDDREFLFDWPLIQNSESGLPAYLSLPDLLMGELPSTHIGVFRPIRSVFYLVNYSLYGQNPLGYHVQALVVHILIVLVIYLITELITGKKLPAFIVASLFATHPVHTEAVSFITASFDTIGILFFFIAFYFYLAFIKKKTEKTTNLFASLLFAAIAFFTYEMTLVLPLLIIFYDFCTSNYSLSKLSPKIPVYKYYVFLFIIYLLVRFLILGVGDRSNLGANFVVVANQARVGMGEILFKYLYVLSWPTSFNLSISHLLPSATLNKFMWSLNYIDPSGALLNKSASVAFIFPFIYAALFILISFLFLRKLPLLFFSFSWIFLSLLPASNIAPQGAAIGLRFLYIPSFGFTLFFGLVFYYLLNNSRYKFVKYATAIVLVSTIGFYSFFTITRNWDWKDEETFWIATMETNPWDRRSYIAGSKVYTKAGKYEKAESFLNRALTNNPNNAEIYSELGIIFSLKGDLPRAEEYQKKALTLESEYYLANFYLGNIYFSQKKFSEAELQYQKVIHYDPSNFETYKALGDLYFEQQKYKLAVENYQKSTSINSNVSDTHYKIGLSYLKLSEFSLAEESLLKSVEIKPDLSQAYLELSALYTQKGNFRKAKEILEKGLLKSGNNELRAKLDSIGN